MGRTVNQKNIKTATYLCVLDHNQDGFTISCPDFPHGGFVANAETKAEALAMAQESLALYLFEVGNPAPHFQDLADVPKSVLAALLAPPLQPQAVWLTPAPINPVSLEVARILERSDHTLRSLAKQMQTSPAALTRMKDPFYWGHSLKTLHALASVTGTRVDFKFKTQRNSHSSIHV
jgi:antitoxin HicB